VSLSPALVDIYLASVHHDLADIERCVTQGDEKALNTALHKMKGAAKMVGATPGRGDRPWQEAPGHPLAAALRQCVEEVCRQLGESMT
jgi:HPt (histidine-containing phosphotransfer) domain-containing protein